MVEEDERAHHLPVSKGQYATHGKAPEVARTAGYH
jgi:hypothetical protein